MLDDPDHAGRSGVVGGGVGKDCGSENLSEAISVTGTVEKALAEAWLMVQYCPEPRGN